MRRRPHILNSELQSSESYDISSPSPEMGVVIRSLLTILLAQSAADGVVRSIELSGIRRRIQSLYHLDDLHFDRYARQATEDAALLGGVALENALYQVNKWFSPEQKTRVLHLLLEVAERDNELSPAEIQFVHKVKEQISL